MKITIANFEGMQPKLASHLLKDNQAQVASNCRVEKADLRSWRQPSVQQIIATNTYKSLYQYKEGGNSHWLYSLNDLDFVETPIAEDAFKRLYFTGEEQPRAYANDLVGSPFDQTSDYYKFGAAKPSAAAVASAGWKAWNKLVFSGNVADGETVTINGVDVYEFDTNSSYTGIQVDVSADQSPEAAVIALAAEIAAHDTQGVGGYAGTGSEDHILYVQADAVGVAGNSITTTETCANAAFSSSTLLGGLDNPLTGSAFRAYVYTYVSRYGEETGPSPVVSVTNYASGTFVLSGFTQPPSGYALDTKIGSNAPKIRVYRTNASVSNAEFQYVGEFDIDAYNWAYASFADAVSDANLGEVLPTKIYEGIPSDLKGLISLFGGIFAGFRENEVCLSVPYQPHAWPNSYKYSFKFKVVGLGTYDKTLIVLTEGIPYMLIGTDPGSMEPIPLSGFYPCISKRSIASTVYGVVYASNEGLTCINNNGPQLLTFNYLTATDWEAYTPATIHGKFFNGKYFGFFNDSAGFVFDLENKLFTTLAEYWRAQYVGVTGGSFYLIHSDAQTGITAIKKWEGDIYNYLYYIWKSKKFLSFLDSGFTCGQILIDLEMYEELLKSIEDNNYLESLNAAVWSSGNLLDTFNAGTFTSNVLFNMEEFNGSALIDFTAIKINNIIKFILYVDNKKIMEKNISSDKYFRIPPRRGRRVELQLSGYLPIKRVVLAQSFEELRE